MKDWDGIRRDLASVGPGIEYAQNVRFWIEGELQRRHGLTKFSAQSGTNIISYRNNLTGYWAVFRTSTGTIEAVAAAS